MRKPLKKLAIVLQTASTGGWRYVQRLMEGLKIASPELEVTCFLGAPLLETFAQEQPLEIVRTLGARAQLWPDVPPAPPDHKFRPLRAYRHRSAAQKFERWLSGLNEFDAVLFAWPFGIPCPALSTRVFFVPHDFNYLHFVGSWTMAAADIEWQRNMHSSWLARATPIVSSQFIAEELTNHFPEYTQKVDVVPLTRLSQQSPLPQAEALKCVHDLGIHSRYILSPNNVSYHKNLGQVLGAFHYVQQQYPGLQLVICGHNTTGITGRLSTPYYLDRFDRSASSENVQPVVSLGMLSDYQVAALIQQAELVINASLYEAGNGSGLDAWSLGTPVVMSNIPAFLEHQDTLGVVAETFHPRNCFDIRDAIVRVLANPSHARQMAEHSQAAISRYTWAAVAQGYLDVFARGLNS